MDSPGFICHDDYLQKMAKLSDAELGRVFRALMEYHANKVEPELDALESMAFDFIRVDIDNADKKYKDKCETNRRNRLEAIENNERQRSSTNVNDGDKYNNKNNNKNNDKDINKKESTKEKEPQKRFTPPTVDEVAEYCKERNNGIDPQYFIDYQTARNWILSNGKQCKDWRATIRTWEQHNYNRSTQKVVSAQQYGQRDYSGEQDDAMKRMLERMKKANAG